jgi:FkbM family methyltransferase
MLHRMGEGFAILPQPDWGDSQYDPEDVPLLPSPYNFMDVGAYDGDTLESLRRRNKVLNKVVCFEPDMRNFRKLAERVYKNGPFAREIQLIPAAVGDGCQTLTFTADGTEAASVSASGSVSVPAVSIDSAIYGFEPNYIKLDIEGHEESALKGLRRTFEKYRPMLAVSAYHRPQDLYLLPLMLRRWDLDVDFYLRMHGSHCFDTVLYIIPRET